MVVAPNFRPDDSYSPMGHTMTADTRVTDAEYRVIGAIKAHDWRDGYCRASQAEIAADCAKDERTVRRLIGSLKAKHLLIEENDPTRPGRARVYRLTGVAATFQTGQLWPVSRKPERTQTGQNRPNESAKVGHINWPNPAGYKKNPENPEKTVVPELIPPASGAAAAATETSPIAKPAPVVVVPEPAPVPTSPARRRARDGQVPSAGTEEILAYYRECWGKPRKQFNPTQIRLMNDAVEELGVDWIKPSILHFSKRDVDSIDSARSGAYTRAKNIGWVKGQPRPDLAKDPTQRADQQGGGDRSHFLDSRQPHRAARYQQQNRPGSTGKPGDAISPDVAASDETWDTPWWETPSRAELAQQEQQDQP